MLSQEKTKQTTSKLSEITLEQIQSAVDPAIPLSVLEAPSQDEQLLNAAIHKLSSLLKVRSVEHLMTYSTRGNLPESTRIAAVEELIKFIPENAFVRKHLLDLFVDSSAPPEIRKAASAVKDELVTPLIMPPLKQHLLEIAAENNNLSHGGTQATIRAAAAEMAGADGLSIALKVLGDSREGAATRIFMANLLIHRAEPAHSPELLNILTNEARQDLPNTDPLHAMTMYQTLLALRETDPEKYPYRLEALYTNSSNAIFNRNLSQQLLENFPGDRSEIIRLILQHPDTEPEDKESAILAYPKNFTESELQVLHDYSTDSLTQHETKESALRPRYALHILHDGNQDLALSLARTILINASQSTDSELPVNHALAVLAEHESSKNAQSTARSIALDNNAMAPLRKDALAYLQETDPEYFQDVLLELPPEARALEIIPEPVAYAEPYPEPNSRTLDEHIEVLDQATHLGLSERLAIVTLIATNDSSVDTQLVTLLNKHGQNEVKVALAEALAARGRSEGLPALIELGKDVDLTQYAVPALFRLSQPNATEQLFGILTHENESVRAQARNAMRRIYAEHGSSEVRKRFVEASLDETLSGRSGIRDYVRSLHAAEYFKIEHPYRFAPATLKMLIDGRRDDPPQTLSNGKEALLVYAKADHNGVFVHTDKHVQALLQNGYNVRVFEISAENELQSLLSSRGASGKRADVIGIFGHGSLRGVSLGGGHLEPSDIEDFRRAEVQKALQNNGQVFLLSCKAGAGASEEANSANTMRAIFPNAGENRIFSPRFDTSQFQFQFDSNGYLIDVHYDVEQYLAKELRSPKRSLLA